MRVLVTGGAGFIGLAAANALKARGDEVRIMDALTQPVHPPGAKGPQGFEFVAADVSVKDEWIKALDGVDAVMHFAAYQDYLPDFSKFFRVNAAGTALMYETIVERNLPIERVVVASSQAVFGEGAYTCEDDGFVAPEPRSPEQLSGREWEPRCPQCGAAIDPARTPEEMADPRSSYGISKLAQEQVALALGGAHGIPTVALRYSIVHGAGQSPRNAYSGLLRSACLNLLAGLPPIVFEDGLQQRDYVAIDDVTSANLLALDHPDAPGRAYNVGGGKSWTILEVLDALRDVTGVTVDPMLPGVWRVGDTRHIISDISRLQQLGWNPAADLKRVWGGYWDWLRALDVDPAIARRAYDDMIARGVLRDTAT